MCKRLSKEGIEFMAELQPDNEAKQAILQHEIELLELKKKVQHENNNNIERSDQVV